MLTKQNINVPLLNGLDTINDPFLIDVGSQAEINNGVYTKAGAIQKRFGTTALSTDVLGSDNSLTGTLHLTTFNDDLVAMTSSELYSYIPEKEQWVKKGDFSTVNIDTKPIARTNRTQTQFDYIENNNIAVSIWKQENDILYSVQDTTTDSNIVASQKVHDSSISGISGFFPRLASVQNNTLLFYWQTGGAITGSELHCRAITYNDPNVLSTPKIDITGAEAIVYTGLSGDYLLPYAVLENGNKCLVTVQDSSESKMRFIYTNGVGNSTLAWLPTPVSTPSGVWAEESLGITIQNSTIVAAYKSSTDDGNLLFMRDFLVDSSDTDNYKNITGLPGVLGNGLVSILVNDAYTYTIASSNNITGNPVTDAQVSIWDIQTNSLDVSSLTGFSITGTSKGVKNNIQLATNLFKVDGVTHFIGSYQGATSDALNLQPTSFIFDTDYNLKGKILAGIAGNHVESLPRVIVDDNVRTLVGIRTRLATQDGKLLAPQGIARVELDFNNPTITTTQLGENLHLSTGLLYNYDGQNVVEHGFHLFPEEPTYSQITGGSLISGVYAYTAVFEWIDVQGQVHQSAPSDPINVTITGASKNIAVTVASTPATSKPDIEVVLYRTQDGGTTYYRVKSASMGASSTTITDDVTDATIAGNQLLYTVGGIFENIAPPACKIVYKHNNRLFIAGLEDRNSIWYSKESAPTEAVNFTDLFQLRVNPAGGPVTALASLDDKLVIFKEDAIYVLAGQGPADTGAQNDYNQPQFVTSNIGCKNTASIVTIPEGVMFQSDKGIWLLDRSASLQYIGEAVDSFNNLVVTSAVTLPDVNQVRFTTSDRCLVYQNHLKKWSTFTNYAAKSATIYKGGYYLVNTNGLVNMEDSSKRTDGSTFIPFKIVTGWIKSGVQDRMHAYRAGFLGRTNGETVARITKYVDYNEEIPEIKYFDTTQQLDASFFGDEAYFGTTKVFGVDKTKRYQFTYDFDVQRCSCVKFVIEDLPATSLDSWFELVNITMQIGVKPGVMDKASTAT